MSGCNHNRTIGGSAPSIADPNDSSFDSLEVHIEENLGLPAKVTGHSWYSACRVHRYIADSFLSGNGFLVGDDGTKKTMYVATAQK